MKLSHRRAVAVLCISSLTHVGSALAQPRQTLEGRVTQAQGRKPLAGVRVRLKETGEEAVTDADGRYAFAQAPAGRHTLLVDAGIGDPLEKPVDVADDGVTIADVVIAGGATGAPAAADVRLDTIEVRAQYSSRELARATQEQAPNLVNLTTAEEIRKLPDVNAAEAVRRIPGISLETDTGEGRFINIRGLDADLNSTTFDGLRLPPSNNASPFGGGRAVALDAIPTGLIGAITVTKTNLPEQDAEALGGTVEITPKAAPLKARTFLEGHVGTGRELARNTGIIDVSATGGGRFGFGGDADYRPFSAVATASYYDNKRSIDDVEAAYVDAQPTTPDKALSTLEQRYYNYHRRRYGFGLELGYQPDPLNKYYVRGFETGYIERINRQRLIFNLSGNVTPDPSNPNGLVDSGVTFDKALRDEREKIENRVFAVGGRNSFGEKTLDYRLGFTRGSYDKQYDYNSDFNYSPPNATFTYDNSSDPNYPRYSVQGANPLDTSQYTLASFQNSVQNIADHEYSGSTNLKLRTHLGQSEEENVKLGLNARLRERTASGQPYSYPNLPALTLDQVASGPGITYYDNHYQNGPQIDGNAVHGDVAGAGAASISVNDQVNALLQATNSKEDVYAGYGQYQFGLGRLGVIAGLRVEYTDATYKANGVSFGPDANGNTQINSVTPQSVSSNYLNFFPGVQGRYELAKDLILRPAFSSTIARPGFNQVSAALNVNPAADTVTKGNPGLKPVTSNNLDLSIEAYLPDAGILSFGIFDKEISNYIINQVTTQTFPNNGLFAGFTGVAKVVTYANSPDARVYGLEVNYEQRYRRLPGAFSGLGTSFNYTYVDSSAQIRPGETAPLPSTSRNTANASVFFEKYGLNLRLSGYYVSRNLFGVGQTRALDIYSEPRFSLDFGSSYALTRNVSVYFDAKNLTDTRLKFTEGSSNRPIQREFYGQTLLAGLGFNL